VTRPRRPRACLYSCAPAAPERLGGNRSSKRSSSSAPERGREELHSPAELGRRLRRHPSRPGLGGKRYRGANG
jgi:hypothetical protein